MEITPFTIDVPEADVRDLKARLRQHALALGCRFRLESRHAGVVRPRARRSLGERIRLGGPGSNG